MAKTLEELQELERKQAEREKVLAEIEKTIHRKEVTFNMDNYVVMANNMVFHSASNLSLNEMKLLKFVIMQTEMGDTELYTLDIPAKELCRMLEIKSKDMYKRLDTMTNHLMNEFIRIGDDSKQKWKKYNWLDKCEYENGIITIKLCESLRPFLLDLKGCFTRYQLSEIISFKSTHAIKIYEMIMGYLNENNLPYADNAVEISISMEELRKNTNTETKFPRPYDFKKKVLNVALKEINDKSKFHVTATEYRQGQTVKGFEFLIESQAGYWHRTQTAVDPDDQIAGQMKITDYI